MLIVILIILLTATAIVWSQRSTHRAQLRDSLHFDNDGLPRLRISVVVCRAQSVNYIASLLKSESAAYQVVVVVDFATQRALLTEIIHYFALIKTFYTPSRELPPQAIRALYRSHRRLFSKIVVVDSPLSHLYTPFEVGAIVSDYNYNLQLRSFRSLRYSAIENLILELATRPEGEVEQITSALGERFKLLYREAALPKSAEKIEVNSRGRLKIFYRILR